MSSGTAISSTSAGRAMIFSPCIENITTIVNKRAMSVIGLIFGNEPAAVPGLALQPHEDGPGEHPRQERHTQVDEDAPGDLADGDGQVSAPSSPRSGGRTVMNSHA